MPTIFLVNFSGNYPVLPTKASGLRSPSFSWVNPGPAPGIKFNEIKAVDKDTIWSVGDDGYIARCAYTNTREEYYNQGNCIWTTYHYGSAYGNSPTTNDLNSLYIENANSIWAVGDNGTIVWFNGSEWQLQSSGTTSDLYSVSGANGRVWAVGTENTILYFDGNTWSNQTGVLNGVTLFGGYYPDYDNNGLDSVSAYYHADTAEYTVWAAGKGNVVKYDEDTGWSIVVRRDSEEMTNWPNADPMVPADPVPIETPNNGYGSEKNPPDYSKIYVEDDSNVWYSFCVNPELINYSCQIVKYNSSINPNWDHWVEATYLDENEQVATTSNIGLILDGIGSKMVAGTPSQVDNSVRRYFIKDTSWDTTVDPNWSYSMSESAPFFPYLLSIALVEVTGQANNTNTRTWILDQLSHGSDHIEEANRFSIYAENIAPKSANINVGNYGFVDFANTDKNNFYGTQSGDYGGYNTFENGRFVGGGSFGKTVYMSNHESDSLDYMWMVCETDVNAHKRIVKYSIDRIPGFGMEYLSQYISGATQVTKIRGDFGERVIAGGYKTVVTTSYVYFDASDNFGTDWSTIYDGSTTGLIGKVSQMSVSGTEVWATLIDTAGGPNVIRYKDGNWSTYAVAGVDGASGIFTFGDKTRISIGNNLSLFNGTSFVTEKTFSATIKSLSGTSNNNLYVLQQGGALSRYNGINWSDFTLDDPGFILMSSAPDGTNYLTDGAYKVARFYYPAASSGVRLKITLPDVSNLRIDNEFTANISVVDADGNIDKSLSPTVNISTSDPADNSRHTAFATLVDGQGTATFNFATPTCGDTCSSGWTITVSDQGRVFDPVTTAPINVGGGTPTSLSISGEKTSIYAGEPVLLTTRLRDSHDNITFDTSDTSLELSSTSSTGKFATSADGPWSSGPWPVTMLSGSINLADNLNFYYLDTTANPSSYTITARSTVKTLVSATYIVTVTNGPISTSTSTFNCNPREVLVGGNIACTVHLINSSGGAAANEPVKVISSRGKLDTIDPEKNTDGNGDATFNVTSTTAGSGIFYAISTQYGIYLAQSVGFKFLSPDASAQSISFSDIASDKSTLVLGKDKATISVTILDQNKTPMPNITVSLLYDPTYGDISSNAVTTNDKGIATFIYTPKKIGDVEIGAKTEAITLDKKVLLNITEGSLLDQLKNSTIAKTIAHVLDPIVAVTAALGLIPLIASIISGAPAGLHALTYGISLSMEALGIRKRRKNWGRVYDSTTGKGVDLALVRLYNQQTMKLVGTIVTNLKGRYNFQPQPGTYVISVTKDGYIYPTQIFAQYGLAKVNKNATRVDSHYLGQPITITEKDNFLNLDIPIDPIAKIPSFLLKTRIWAEDASYLITSGLSYIFMPALIIGALLSSFVAIVLPGTRNMVTSIVYLIITLIYSLSKMIKAHQFSTVIDTNGKPLQGVMISIFDKVHNTLKESRITDRFGRFSIYAEPGQYILKAERRNYDFNPDNLEKEIRKNKSEDKFRGNTINLKKASYIRFTIIGKRK